MKIKAVIQAMVILFVLPLLNACDDSAHHIAGGGISGTGISVGPISAFGSIFVNGIEFETDQAVIIANGHSVTENDLRVGMVVQIEGIIHPDEQSGKALRIHFNDNVSGPVQQIDDDADTLKVLGQTVIIDQLTVLDGIQELTDLNEGDVITVSGLVEANKNIRATWIRREPNLVEFEVVGQVAHLDRVAQTFMIGDLVINYSQTLSLNVSNGVLNDGLLIEVKGTFADTLVGNILMASHIERANELISTDTGTQIEIAGFITRFNNHLDFEVAQLPVTTTSQTIFQLGRINDLALGIKVEVEGELDANGILVLEEVSFQSMSSKRMPTGYIEVEANVEKINIINQIVTLLGLSIQTTPTTQFRDKRDAMVPFRLLNLNQGDRVAISGFWDSTTNVLVADILLREPVAPDNQIVLAGTADNIDSQMGTFTILDITVLTDTNTVYENDSLEAMGLVMSSEKFFTDIQQIKSLIEVQGILIGNIILAEKLELELK